MKTVGITAEYNPFHNGHLYHARLARKLSGADCVIAVMSGDFTQRGEPAVCGKWERAEAAVKSGCVDLVVELPFAYACGRAEVFARGAVDLLAGMGADVISFGCEEADPEILRAAAWAAAAQEEDLVTIRDSYMREGLSAAKAYELAVSETAGEQTALLLRKPNNILAVEYLKRIRFWRERGRELSDLPVKRYGSGYDDVSGEKDFAGGGALRRMIREGEDVSRFLPASMDFADGKLISERYLQLLKGIVLRSSPEEISSIYGVGEGMEHSIIREAREAGSLEELLAALTSKRYTAATVRRALTHVLAGTAWEEIDRITGRIPTAARLLAAGKTGRAFLRELPDEGVRIITNINKEEAGLKPDDAETLRLDEKTADLYNHLCGSEIYAASDRVRRPYVEK